MSRALAKIFVFVFWALFIFIIIIIIFLELGGEGFEQYTFFMKLGVILPLDYVYNHIYIPF